MYIQSTGINALCHAGAISDARIPGLSSVNKGFLQLRAYFKGFIVNSLFFTIFFFLKQTVPVDTSGTIPEDLGTSAPVTMPILPSSPCYYRSTHLFFTSAGQIHCIHCHPTDPLTFFYSTQLFSLMSNLYSQITVCHCPAYTNGLLMALSSLTWNLHPTTSLHGPGAPLQLSLGPSAVGTAGSPHLWPYF